MQRSFIALEPEGDVAARKRTSSRQLNWQMLVVTAALWSFYFAVVQSTAMATMPFDGGMVLARFLYIGAAAVISQVIYLLLRDVKLSGPLVRFAWAAGASVFGCILVTALNGVVVRMFSSNWEEPKEEASRIYMWISTYTFVLWAFIAWSALYATMSHSAEMRERDRRLAEAERMAQQAQLAALRLQIHPHFLFNTLNTLSGLVGLQRLSEAEQMILNLSAFLRRTLVSTPDQLTTVEDELQAELMYLGIEQARFSDRLDVRCEVAEDCRTALTPSLILQPLVENAVKHGLAPSEAEVVITLGAARSDQNLVLWVHNSAGARTGGGPGFGIGLKNVRERLANLFGEDAALDSGPDAGGWTSRIVMPWREQD